MPFLMPNTWSIYIEGNICVPVGSNSYYSEFVLATSGAALRSAKLVEAALEVGIATVKTT